MKGSRSELFLFAVKVYDYKGCQKSKRNVCLLVGDLEKQPEK